MKSKILNFLLLITSLLGYLEWNGNNNSFLFQVEGEIFSKIFTDPVSVLHPLTVLPMISQVVLIITLFQKKPGKVLTYLGMAGLGILLGLIFVTGVISFNYKIIASVIPFIVVSILTMRHYRKIK